MAAVGITENVKGDAKKFEIWYNAREEVYIIQVNYIALHKKKRKKKIWRIFPSVVSLIECDEEM